MKPIKTTLEHQGNMISDSSVKMSFSEESTIHLMSVLTDLYSDKLMALVREYSTNARDAHKVVGIDRPIEVWAPSTLDYDLKIRDFGPGMDLEEIYTYYAQYGASSKRHSDEFNGMLGLGCKSALSYTNQFTVKSIKDGKLLMVLVSRDDTGAGSVSVLTEMETTEESGLEVSFPIGISDISACRDKIVEFFKYWDPKNFKVHGLEVPNEIERMKADDGLFIGDNIYVAKRQQTTYDYRTRTYASQVGNVLVMGDVAYKLEGKHLPNLDSLSNQFNIDVLIYAPIGQISFAPNREALIYDSRLKDYVDNICTHIETTYKDTLQKQIDALIDPKDVFNLWSKWTHVFPVLEWGGNPPVGAKDKVDMKDWWTYSSTANRSQDQSVITIKTGDKTAIFKNFKLTNVPNKVKDYLKTKDEFKNYNKFYFVDNLVTEPYLDSDHIYNFEDHADVIKKIKTETTKKPVAKAKIWQGYRLVDGKFVEADDIVEPFEQDFLFTLPPGTGTYEVSKVGETILNLLIKISDVELVVTPTGGRFNTFAKNVLDIQESHKAGYDDRLIASHITKLALEHHSKAIQVVSPWATNNTLIRLARLMEGDPNNEVAKLIGLIEEIEESKKASDLNLAEIALITKITYENKNKISSSPTLTKKHEECFTQQSTRVEEVKKKISRNPLVASHCQQYYHSSSPNFDLLSKEIVEYAKLKNKEAGIS